MLATLLLSGEDLSVQDVWRVAVDRVPIGLSEAATQQMECGARARRRGSLTSEHTYGVNTGFGRFVSETIPEDQAEELQLRLLRSHACGVGEPYPDDVVRAAMLLRANALAKGYSGARVETVELLLAVLNRGVVPRVPARGSVGASGDLAPLAHLALPLVGEGEAWVDGERMPGAEALARGGPRADQARGEGRAVADQRHAVHGGDGALGARARAAARAAADIACAMSLEALQGSRTSFLAAIHAARPLRGQSRSAANVLRRCSTARRSSSRTAGATRCRTPTRCAARRRCTAPAATCSTTSSATVAIEINAATDNPLVLVERASSRLERQLSRPAGRLRARRLAIAVAELANISERRVERMVNPSLSDGLPAFLTREGGLNSGFMILQYVSAALVSENKVLAIRRASTRSRRAPARRITSRWATPPG